MRVFVVSGLAGDGAFLVFVAVVSVGTGVLAGSIVDGLLNWAAFRLAGSGREVPEWLVPR